MLRKWLTMIGTTAGSFLSITAVTLLIWLYAEGENVRRHEATIDIKIIGMGNRQMVIEPSRRTFQIAFTCATDQLAPFRQLLQDPFTLEVNEDPSQISQILVLRDRLASDPRITRLGINMVDVQPPTLPVRVEALVPLTLPVRVKLPEGTLSETLLIEPVTDPPQATVLLPSSIARKATAETVFEVSPDPARFVGLTPNIVNRLTVPLTLPAALRNGTENAAVTIEPAVVNISVTVRTLTAETTLPAVPIRLVVSPNDLRAYEVPSLMDDHVRNLVLRGPRNVIRDIEQGKQQVYAELRLSAEDLDQAARLREGASKMPVINTPSGVTVSNLTSEVRYQVTRKTP